MTGRDYIAPVPGIPDGEVYVHITAYQEPPPRIMRRAIGAYRRACGKEGIRPEVPAGDSCLCEVDGTLYVVLSLPAGLRAWRCRGGSLTAVSDWPPTITDHYQPGAGNVT